MTVDILAIARAQIDASSSIDPGVLEDGDGDPPACARCNGTVGWDSELEVPDHQLCHPCAGLVLDEMAPRASALAAWVESVMGPKLWPEYHWVRVMASVQAVHVSLPGLMDARTARAAAGAMLRAADELEARAAGAS